MATANDRLTLLAEIERLRGQNEVLAQIRELTASNDALRHANGSAARKAWATRIANGYDASAAARKAAETRKANKVAKLTTTPTDAPKVTPTLTTTTTTTPALVIPMNAPRLVKAGVLVTSARRQASAPWN